MQNIIVANIKAGQIITDKISAEEIPDSMLRDGWVQVHKEAPPKIHVIVEGGRVQSIYSDRTGLLLDCTDLDLCEDPDTVKKSMQADLKGRYHYPVEDPLKK